MVDLLRELAKWLFYLTQSPSSLRPVNTLLYILDPAVFDNFSVYVGTSLVYHPRLRCI